MLFAGRALLLWLCVILAPVNAPAAAATTVDIGLRVTDFDYRESNAGSIINREDGPLPGVALTLARTQPRAFIEGHLSLDAGVVDYSSPAANSRTDTVIIDSRVLAGRLLAELEHGRVYLTGGAGYRDWQRDIRSIPGGPSGLDEDYRWWYAVLGLRLVRELDARSSLQIDVQARYTLAPEIEVDFLGAFDPASADLGERPGARLAATYRRELASGWQVWVRPWFEYWELGRSADTPLFSGGLPTASTFFEPASRTRNLGIGAGVTWRPGG